MRILEWTWSIIIRKFLKKVSFIKFGNFILEFSTEILLVRTWNVPQSSSKRIIFILLELRRYLSSFQIIRKKTNQSFFAPTKSPLPLNCKFIPTTQSIHRQFCRLLNWTFYLRLFDFISEDFLFSAVKREFMEPNKLKLLRRQDFFLKNKQHPFPLLVTLPDVHCAEFCAQCALPMWISGTALWWHGLGIPKGIGVKLSNLHELTVTT
jgi:hypothetical protein